MMSTYNIIKVISGSFHQGNVEKFHEIAGLQCGINCIVSTCFTMVKKISSWSTNDMDFILEAGNECFKQLGYSDYLALDELPSIVHINGHIFNLDKFESIKTIELNIDNDPRILLGNSFLDCLTKSQTVICVSNAIMFMIRKESIYYYLFDSHSRSKVNGEPCEDGFSALIKFKNFNELANYIKYIYLIKQEKRLSFMQMQFYNCVINQSDIIEFKKSLKLNQGKLRSSKHYQANKDDIRKTHKAIVGTPEHENLKTSMKERYVVNKDYVSEKYQANKDVICEKYQANKDVICEKYQANKDVICEKYRDKYAGLIGTPIHKQKLEKRKLSYSEIQGTSKHVTITARKRLKYSEDMKSKNCVLQFEAKVRDGPYYICVSCNRCLFRRSLKIFHENMYAANIENFYFSHIVDDIENTPEYICFTCDSHLKKGSIPAQAVCNKLEIVNVPNEFKDLRKLEKVLVARRILFKRVLTMPRGEFKKLKGKICNVPLDTKDIVDVLPRGSDSNSVLLLKLKRKLEYKNSVFYEAVRPDIVIDFLQYLKQENYLYNDVVINPDNISNELTSEGLSTSDNNDDDSDVDFTVNSENDEIEDPLNQSRLANSETALINETVTDEMIISPCEGNQPLALFADDLCEELAHPFLFPTGKFGYKVEREVFLSPIRYFNQRLLNYTQKFAEDSDYIFFAQNITQHLRIMSRINIAMKKVHGNITAGMLLNNYENTVKTMIQNEEAYKFLSEVKGSPAYWKQFLYDVLAMVRQLGLPTYFLTLSCADLHWNELVYIILKLQGIEIAEDEIQNMSYADRCKILNQNPVLLARQFQYRVELFFKTIVINGPLGKTLYYAIRVEFQLRGSPHIHSFVWILNAPVLCKENINEYKTFIDATVKADMPDKDENPELFNLVKAYQVHSHSKSCRKYKNKKCRYSFGKFFTDETIIAEPLSGYNIYNKEAIMKEKSEILKPVREYIDENLDPHKVNIYDDNVKVKTIDEILDSLDIPYDKYKWALSISSTNDFQIHYKRPPNSCFVNTYFIDGLSAWKANMDIQPVLSTYAAVNYLCSYLSKHEDEVSQAMSDAATEAKETNLSKFQQMKSISRAYTTHREVSIQEAVYHILPELFLRKVFPKVEFANTNLPEDRVRMCLSKKDLENLDQDSTEIYHQNNLDRYMLRPTSLNNICFAEFLSNYDKDKKPIENDCQPVELTDEILNENHSTTQFFPKRIKLHNNEIMKLRKVRKVLRFYIPNKTKYPEKYAHHLLILYKPFKKEVDLATNNSYCETLQDLNVLQIVNENKQKTEPHSEFLDEALLNFQDVLRPDPILDYENDETEIEIQRQNIDVEDDVEDTDTVNYGPAVRPSVLPDIDINEGVRSLNSQQREVFEYVHSWAKRFLKYQNCIVPKKVEPLHLFVTGNAGTGKSFLVNLLFDHLTKLFSYRNPDKVKVLKLAPTGVAAININGETFYSALSIPCKCSSKLLPQLSAKKRDELRHRFSELRVIMIDEISMVSQQSLDYINQRLNEIFDCPPLSIIFANLTVIVSGDLLQLPPVKGIRVYGINKRNPMLSIDKLWNYFKMAELTEVVRQKDDTFVNLLNNCRTGNITDHDIDILNSRHVDNLPESEYPHNVMHLFAENKFVTDYNEKLLRNNSKRIYIIPAMDKAPAGVTNLKRLIANKTQMSLGGLATILKIGIGSQAMITQNISVLDRIVNGQVGVIVHIKFKDDNVNSQPQVIYMKLDDDNAGLDAKRTDVYAMENNCIPIKRSESPITVDRVTFQRKQFPIMLANSCTVHKLQGQELPTGLISFDLFKQKNFTAGQIYVALSRIQSLDGLFISGNVDKEDIRADGIAIAEYIRLREEAPFTMIARFERTDLNFVFAHLNVRSFNRHHCDIEGDSILTNSDLMLLSETQIKKNSDYINTLNGFTVYFQNSEDKFSSLAICYKVGIAIEVEYSLPGLIVFTVCKPSFSAVKIRFLFIYRKNEIPLSDFTYTIRHTMSYCNVIHIILGDFNFNGFGDIPENVKHAFLNFEQIISEPTQISGGLLDQIYVNREIAFSKQTLIKHVYFSDHDATFCLFENN